MNNSNSNRIIKRPVFIVDDDIEEREILDDILKELQIDHPVLYFDNAYAVLDYVHADPTNPFLIICDINLPQMDGFALREKFANEASLRYKSIPFVFWSTTASNDQIKKAYDLGAHGFFFKGHNYAEIKDSLDTIFTYWKSSKAPVI